MNALNKAKEPFKFYTQLHIPELTGLKAANLQELLDLIKTVSGSVIYHHTHRFLQQHQYLSPEPRTTLLIGLRAFWAKTNWGVII